MAVHKLLDKAKTNGVGTSLVNGATFAVYGLTMKGYLGGAYVDILVDLEGGENWVTAGSLRAGTPAQLIMLPAGASCNARVSGATASTEVTVVLAS